MLKKAVLGIQLVALAMLISSCGEKSDIEQQSGTIAVQIPVTAEGTGYKLEVVNLLGIQNFKEVRGEYVRFFYAPGAAGTSLTGGSPRARFIKSDTFFIPTDYISTQMATLYYHLQNLAQLDAQVGAEGINTWPRSVGIETQVLDKERSRNNAFYDGQTDSMMFVPFTAKELPIAVNAGIIAHEHFHSLFYKTVILSAVSNKKLFPTTTAAHEKENKNKVVQIRKVTKPKQVLDKDKAMLFNEVYLRGINEGLADFWGWLYTEDARFMDWSLPSHTSQRTLQMSDESVGAYITELEIIEEIQSQTQMTDDPRIALSNYSYKIGTPHARFIKKWTTLKAEQQGRDITEAKIQVAQKIIKYLKQVQTKVSTLEEKEILRVDNLFQFFADEENAAKTLTKETCDFLKSYLNYGNTNEKTQSKCMTLDDGKIVVK